MAQKGEDVSQMDQEIDKLQQEIQKRKDELKRIQDEKRSKEERERVERYLEKQLKDEYQRQISQMEKVGNHYYHDGERITWEDTFVSEQDDIREKIYGIQFDIAWIWNKLMYALRMIFFMSKGFFDRGKSFDEGIDILEDEFMLSQIVSPQTMVFFQKEKVALMQHYNIDDAFDIARNHFTERLTHLKHNVRPFDFLFHLLQAIFLIILTIPGKFSIMSPVITAQLPSFVTADLITIQLILGWVFYQYYAHGNLLMIMTLMWTLSQWFCMYLLLWNEEIYLYDLRLLRYFVLFGAIIFEFIYYGGISAELELVWIEGKIYKEDNAVEVVLALIIGQILIYYFPTALVNLFIIMKEMTLNQFAWRKKEDFREGEFFNLFNIDIFYYLDFDEDIYNHLFWLAGWSHYFL